MENSALLLRLQSILENSRSNKTSYSSEAFIEKLGEIAELTRVRNNEALLIHSDDVLATVESAEAAAQFLEIAVEAGLLTHSSQGEPLFRDIFDRDGHAARYLMKYLKSDYVDQGFIRDQAVSALVHIGAPAIPQLILCLGHDESDVRLAASVALRKLGEIAVPALIQAINYGNEYVRRSVAEALTSESSKLATDPLIKLLLNDEAPLVRAAAALALKEGGTQEGIEALVDALNDSDSLVLLMVKGALQDLDTPLARRALEDYNSGPKRLSGNQRVAGKLEEDLKQTAKPPRIFLSYPREHNVDVNKVRKLFLDAGFEVWLDSEKLLAGQRWENSLNDAIKSSDFVVAFLSKHTSDGFQMEELRAATQYIPKGRDTDYVFLLPCVVDSDIWNGLPESVPEFLQEYHMIDLKNLDDGWLVLRRAITTAARKAGFFVPVYLRTEAHTDLEPAAVNKILVTRNYYDKKINNQGRPPYMDFGVTYHR